MTAEVRLRSIVLLALIGLFVALYLLLYHLGFYGVLVCGTGSCDAVQASEYARFLGQPVPLWGTLWYAAIIALAFLALGPLSGSDAPPRLLGLAAVAGLLFSAYLTAVELFVIHAVCMWCVVSAVITVAIFVLARPWKTLKRSPPAAGG
jgi:uncharacterized membrane protein